MVFAFLLVVVAVGFGSLSGQRKSARSSKRHLDVVGPSDDVTVVVKVGNTIE